jgi:small-conductance mechanosensitive channel
MTTPSNTSPADNLHRDDISLQGWGARLPKYAIAVEESLTENRKATERSDKLATALQRLATQAGSDMPAAAPLTAAMEAAAAEAAKIAAERAALDSREAKVLGQVEGFKPMYDREHETDNDRLQRPRRGLAQEQRADVGRAAQDL